MSSSTSMAVQEILARTAYAENRGGGSVGMTSVMNAVANRVKFPRWWGHDLTSVCLCEQDGVYQFSCWAPGTENHAAMMAVTDSDVSFRLAMALATSLVSGHMSDLTGGADSYYSLSMKHPPSWAAKSVHTKTLAGQAFYNTRGASLAFRDLAVPHA